MKKLITIAILGGSLSACSPTYEYQERYSNTSWQAQPVQCPLQMNFFGMYQECPDTEDYSDGFDHACNELLGPARLSSYGRSYSRQDILAMKNEGWTIESESEGFHTTIYNPRKALKYKVTCNFTVFNMEKEISPWETLAEKLGI